MLRKTLLRTPPPFLLAAHSQLPPFSIAVRHQSLCSASRSLHKRTLPAVDPRTSARYPTQSVMAFHSSPKRQGAPFVALLAAVLKTSAALEYARMAARIALTFVPVVLIKNHRSRKYIFHVIKDKPELQEKKAHLQQRIRKGIVFARTLIIFPIVIFTLTLLASLERAPISGRWRLILLSPEEEDEIARQLAGPGWYSAIADILARENPPPRVLPPSDWRYRWVLDTMRQLESAIPVLAHEHYADDATWLERGPDDAPLPPPPKYPLRPRPAAKDVLRWFCEMSAARVTPPAPHTIPGPPYSLVIVDRADCDNAFSFGFGPGGGGGIVVYAGFLDEVIANCPCPAPASGAEGGGGAPAQAGFWAGLRGIFGALTPAPAPAAPAPTPEQTAQLAILLAHELAHLILSHHLETLSSATVIIPGTLSMVSDLLRALLFPVTMLFGPFVNDAVANLGKVGSGEFGKIHEYCTSVKQEFEADAVSARLLAHAGYDARSTVRFWEARHDRETAECSPKRAQELRGKRGEHTGPMSLARNIMGSTHPIHERRVLRLRQELDHWETERLEVRRQLLA